MFIRIDVFFLQVYLCWPAGRLSSHGTTFAVKFAALLLPALLIGLKIDGPSEMTDALLH